MKIGLIMMTEEYWSLQKLTADVFYSLKSHYEVLPVFLTKDNSLDQKNVDDGSVFHSLLFFMLC